MIKTKYPFGHTMILGFEKGDLVYWNQWKVENKILNRYKKYGTFMNKHSKFIGNREILYATVIEAETGNTIDILAIRLKKEETT